MLALWNSDVIDRLPNNYNLAYNILQSSTKKLNESQLFQYDEVIQQQIENGIVELIEENAYNLRKDCNKSF